jgi:uncharacterized protein involved in exopolysaccharide biosynthesis
MRMSPGIGNSAGKEGPSLAELAGLIWASRLLMAIVVASAVLVATIYAFVATPMFRAEVVVTEVRDGSAGDLASMAGKLGGLASLAGLNLSGGDSTAVESMATLKSRRLAEEFITRTGIVQELLRGGRRDPTLWRAVERFRKEVLSIREDQRNSTTTVAVDWKDPLVAASWANGYVALANETLRSRAMHDATRNIDYLNAQVARTSVVEVQRVMYQLIESQTKTLMLANQREEYAFAVVDSAVPPEIRTSPHRTLIVFGGLLFGLLAGATLAYLRSTMRRGSGPTAGVEAHGS